MTDPASPSGLYAYTECDAVNMQGGATLIIDWWSDAQLLASPSVASSMQLCRRFRTLEGHAEHLARNVPELAGQQAEVMKVLGMVRDAGLMVSADSVCEKLNTAVPEALDLPATRVFIITCDRPAAVERLLESMLRSGNLARHERLVLVDDSRDADNARRNRELVDNFNLTCPRDMHYIGAAEAAALMDALIAASPDHEDGIRYLIDRTRWSQHKSYGLARNLCLLLSVDRRAIVLDDDTLCTALQAPDREPGVDFGRVERETGFYTDYDDMFRQLVSADSDPLSAHASCLGLSMGQALRKLLGRPVTAADLDGGASSYLNLWQAASPVLVTQCGTAGDPGTPGTEWLYYAEGKTARRLADFPGGLQGAMASRCYWLGHPRANFGKVGSMSQMTGLDNTRLLPPYLPVFRGEDAVFGAMTEYLHPRGAVLNYDWAVPHVPTERREAHADPEAVKGTGMFSLPKFLTDQTNYRDGASAGARLQQLASLARELGETDNRGLLTIYRREAAELLGLERSKLKAVLNNGSIKPPVWQGWLEQSRDNCNRAMQQPAEPGQLANLPEGMGSGEVLDAVRDHAAGLAAALSGWEAIRRAAVDAADTVLADA